MSDTGKNVVFEARESGGRLFRVFMDGTTEGFEPCHYVSNRWLSYLHLENGLRIKAENKLAIAIEELAKRGVSWPVVGASAEHESDGRSVRAEVVVIPAGLEVVANADDGASAIDGKAHGIHRFYELTGAIKGFLRVIDVDVVPRHETPNV